MNQATNRIPYGLLTEEEEVQFSTEARARGMYEYRHPLSTGWSDAAGVGSFSYESAYRLKILPDEWYYVDGKVKKGFHVGFGVDRAKVLRPARPEEIPAEEDPENLKVRIQGWWPDKRVEMLEYKYPIQVLMFCDGGPDNYIEHYQAQSRKSFMGYVYKQINHSYYLYDYPVNTCEDPIHPVAVLFEKGADDE